MTKSEIKLLRSIFKCEITDEEAAMLYDQVLEFAQEIKDEFRHLYDPDDRP